MATVRQYVTKALIEIGAIAAGETPSAADAALGLDWFKMLLDSYRAERAAMAVQKLVTYTWPSGQSFRTIGPGGQIDTPQRPTWLDQAQYQNPGTSPAQWVDLAVMTPEVYASLTIPEQSNSLPEAIFYQTSNDTLLGSVFLWMQITQDVTIRLFFQAGLDPSITLDDVLLPPPGYELGMHYQLSELLLTPFTISNPAVLGRVARNSEVYYARMKRPNLQPGQLGVDPAVAGANGMGYNVLSDSYTGNPR